MDHFFYLLSTIYYLRSSISDDIATSAGPPLRTGDPAGIRRKTKTPERGRARLRADCGLWMVDGAWTVNDTSPSGGGGSGTSGAACPHLFAAPQVISEQYRASRPRCGYHGAGTAFTRTNKLGLASRALGTLTVISSTGVALFETVESGAKPGHPPSVVDDS